MASLDSLNSEISVVNHQDLTGVSQGAGNLSNTDNTSIAQEMTKHNEPLPDDEIKAMKSIGLNPENPDDVAIWNNKPETERLEIINQCLQNLQQTTEQTVSEDIQPSIVLPENWDKMTLSKKQSVLKDILGRQKYGDEWDKMNSIQKNQAIKEDYKKIIEALYPDFSSYGLHKQKEILSDFAYQLIGVIDKLTNEGKPINAENIINLLNENKNKSQEEITHDNAERIKIDNQQQQEIITLYNEQLKEKFPDGYTYSQELDFIKSFMEANNRTADNLPDELRQRYDVLVNLESSSESSMSESVSDEATTTLDKIISNLNKDENGNLINNDKKNNEIIRLYVDQMSVDDFKNLYNNLSTKDKEIILNALLSTGKSAMVKDKLDALNIQTSVDIKAETIKKQQKQIELKKDYYNKLQSELFEITGHKDNTIGEWCDFLKNKLQDPNLSDPEKKALEAILLKYENLKNLFIDGENYVIKAGDKDISEFIEGLNTEGLNADQKNQLICEYIKQIGPDKFKEMFGNLHVGAQRDLIEAIIQNYEQFTEEELAELGISREYIAQVFAKKQMGESISDDTITNAVAFFNEDENANWDYAGKFIDEYFSQDLKDYIEQYFTEQGNTQILEKIHKYSNYSAGDGSVSDSSSHSTQTGSVSSSTTTYTTNYTTNPIITSQTTSSTIEQAVSVTQAQIEDVNNDHKSQEDFIREFNQRDVDEQMAIVDSLPENYKKSAILMIARFNPLLLGQYILQGRGVELLNMNLPLDVRNKIIDMMFRSGDQKTINAAKKFIMAHKLEKVYPTYMKEELAMQKLQNSMGSFNLKA